MTMRMSHRHNECVSFLPIKALFADQGGPTSSNKVYETDPLICPKCQGEMRIIGIIDQPEVIKKSFASWVYGKSPIHQLIEPLHKNGS